MSVITDDEGLINDLFVRLNRSRPLNGAEIRNAMRGIVPDLFRKIVEHDFFVNIVSFNVKRKADLNIAAKLLLLEYRGELVDTKRVQLDRFVEDGIQLESSDIQSAFDRVIYVLDKMSKEFINDDPVLKLASGIPVYYWYFRNIDNVIGVRDKIIKFEKLRKINKEKASQGLNDVDDKIQKFDYYNRSPDDATSHEFRYKILCEYLNII
jgi:hypothetical protein